MSKTDLDPRTTVHHTILDLYELHDYGQVCATDIAEYTGIPHTEVDIALCALEASGTIATDDLGVIVDVQNAGYFPTAQKG